MKFIFRTDASLRIGTGHVMRCLTLAKALRERGAGCKFVCRDLEGNLIEKIRQEGFECVALAKPPEINEMYDADASVLAHADRFTASCRNDSLEVINVLGNERVDWLVVDHYSLDKRWEEALRWYAQKIMVIDDLAERSHDCDLLLDQNLVANFEKRYQNLLPEHCATLLGPQYALQQPEYAELRTRTPPRTGPVKRVLIFFGGADQQNLTGRVVCAFFTLKRNDIVLDVVLSSHSPHKAGIQEQVRQHANIFVHDALPTLAPLMLQADLAIGAGGATSWERCCLGLPSLVITLAENQKAIAAELHQRGLVRWLGHYDTVTEEVLVEAIQAAIDNKELENWSRACMTITDGGGVDRVASVLMLNSKEKITARFARLEDEALLLRWANDPLIRANAADPRVISAKKFRKWFYSSLRDLKLINIYVIETAEEVPIGQVKFERVRGEWEIHYSLASFARGLGIERNLLRIAVKAFRIGNNGAQVLGRIMEGNLLFQKKSDEFGLPGSRSDKLSIAICSDVKSWINDSIPELLLNLMGFGHTCTWVNNADELEGGDLCFYLSYSRIVKEEKLAQFKNNLVVHASDLPKGRGWSPASWLILEGKNRIPVTLIEALPDVDSGPIYDQIWMDLDQTDLIDDWHVKLSEATVSVVQRFVLSYPLSVYRKRDQEGEPSFYPKRTPKDSELDVNKTLLEQINSLRIADNKYYPAFFELHGSEFVLNIYKRASTKN
jgi:UDP-2,4-diacetamido-2,4,6-trideoxy-beta-L-altropyranose hydrolase